MQDYKKQVEALRLCQFGECGCGKCYYKELKGDWCTEDNHPEFFDCDDKLKLDAADAIEALQAELPKRGEWELIDGVEPMRWGCSRCKYLSWETSNYCPRCGAKMFASDINVLNKNDTTDGPIITPCRGCSDYDGYGGCKSKGGCARTKMEVQDGK